ncbi:MAG: cytochrome C, partial [Planctomycetota bacterium]
PVNPHTSHRPRSCESCHATEKAMGYGINGGRQIGSWDQPIVIDLKTADGQVLPRSARNQFEPIAGLTADWSRFVTEDGKQLQTVGHHFSLSRPLNNRERAHMSREGICLSCHQEISKESLAVSFLHHAADAIDAIPKTTKQHDSLVHKLLLLTAWGQVGGGVVGGLAGLLVLVWYMRRRRKARGKT